MRRGNARPTQSSWAYSPAPRVGLGALLGDQGIGECWRHRKAEDLWETGIWNISRYFRLICEAGCLKKNTIICLYSFSVLRVKAKNHKRNNFRKELFCKLKIGCFLTIVFRVTGYKGKVCKG